MEGRKAERKEGRKEGRNEMLEDKPFLVWKINGKVEKTKQTKE